MSGENDDKDDATSYSDDAASQTAPKGFGKRHLLAVMSFLGFINVYCMRVNLSVALVVMANSTADPTKSSNDTSQECEDHSLQNATSTSPGEFNWSEGTQGIILGSFFYGYIVTQIPGGQMAERFGGKKVFGFGVLVTSVLSMFSPVVARSLGVGAFIALRVLIGIGEGVTYPSMHTILGKWAPKWERSKLTTFVYAGCNLGTVIAFPISGLLCDSSFLGGWPSVFYVFGVCGCVWFILWVILIHDTPAEHPGISQEERLFIESSVGRKVDGFLSALPNLLSWFLQVVGGWVSDLLRTHGYLSTVNTRKLFVGLGLMGSTCILPFIKYVGCNHVIVIVLLTLSGGLSGLGQVGFTVNHLDIACNFAGTLLGITNSFSTAAGIVAPYVVGILTQNHETRDQWQIVFYISAAMYASGAIVFIFLAKGQELTWNRPKFYSEHEKLIQPKD